MPGGPVDAGFKQVSELPSGSPPFYLPQCWRCDRIAFCRHLLPTLQIALAVVGLGACLLLRWRSTGRSAERRTCRGLNGISADCEGRIPTYVDCRRDEHRTCARVLKVRGVETAVCGNPRLPPPSLDSGSSAADTKPDSSVRRD